MGKVINISGMILLGCICLAAAQVATPPVSAQGAPPVFAQGAPPTTAPSGPQTTNPLFLNVTFNTNCPAQFYTGGANNVSVVSDPRPVILECGICTKLPAGISSWEYNLTVGATPSDPYSDDDSDSEDYDYSDYGTSVSSSSVQVFLSDDCTGANTTGRHVGNAGAFCQPSNSGAQAYDLLLPNGASDPSYGANGIAFNDNIRSARLSDDYCEYY